MVLVGRGSVRASLPALIAFPLVAAVVSVVGVGALSITDPGVRDDVSGLVFVVLIGTFCGLGASVYLLVWVTVFVGRVRYYVDGTAVVVRRGERTIATKDMSAARLIRIDGWVDTRRCFYAVGPRWTSSSGLPHVYVEEASTGRSTTEYELPDVFVWGRDGAARFHQALFHELTRSGIHPEVFVAGGGQGERGTWPVPDLDWG
ncbi:hypothetical protein IFT73_06225 [Aeromicrobium sp. CFBP 8757]|uniref:hypothetical protein n=1 Tax=Aeromicrobium sp. CFBP 8757 TaxID=2775288 RepID=UPI00177FFC26|nr:hypothetical protein [Aeromicrobium sp. CFBP 8757]MBD8606446.1 hypothetical protein [Aeromicrobium sp. CFBP 8757]